MAGDAKPSSATGLAVVCVGRLRYRVEDESNFLPFVGVLATVLVVVVVVVVVVPPSLPPSLPLFYSLLGLLVTPSSFFFVFIFFYFIFNSHFHQNRHLMPSGRCIKQPKHLIVESLRPAQPRVSSSSVHWQAMIRGLWVSTSVFARES